MSRILLFPLAALICSIWAFLTPELFIPMKMIIIPLLGVVMFGMGMSIETADFIAVGKRPAVIMTGVLLQFILMPLLAFLLAHLFQLPKALLLGFVLLGACPGGTASNVICYLAKGDVALSIVLTMISTLLAVLLTPWITWCYVGEVVNVPLWKMMKMIFWVIVIPVLGGMFIRQWLEQSSKNLQNIMPGLSMAAIVLIIAIIVALNRAMLAELAIPVVMVVVLHNLLGLIVAYHIGKALGYSRKICKTLAIEVGMQNSGLAVALASQFFTPLAALPGALFSIWHNLSGAIFASMSQRTLIKNELRTHI